MSFFTAAAPTEIYTLSLHDALPIFAQTERVGATAPERIDSSADATQAPPSADATQADRKSTRLNSSHTVISYAVFRLKKKSNITSAHSEVAVSALVCFFVFCAGRRT